MACEMPMGSAVFTEEHFFDLARQDIKDAESLFEKGSLRNGLNFVCRAEEKTGKGLLCGTGFIQDKKDIRESKKAIEAYPMDEATRHSLLLILDAMEKQAPDDKKELLMKYGHAWHMEFVKMLSLISQPVDDMMVTSDLLASIGAPSHPVSAMWHTGDFKLRTENVKSKLGDPAKFRNPPIADVDLVLDSDNKLLDSASSYRFSEADSEQIYQRLFKGAPLAQNKVTPQMLEKQIGRTFKLTAIADLAVYLAPHYNLSSYLDENTDFEYDEKLSVIHRRMAIIALISRCLG